MMVPSFASLFLRTASALSRAAGIGKRRCGMSSLAINCSIFSVTFSPDGQRIATAGDDQTARVWAAGDGELLAIKRHGSPISSVAFSPDGQRIVTGGGSISF